MQTTNKAGLDLIKSFENYVPRAYRCIAGKWTIGYGDTEGVFPGMIITPAEAERRLLKRLLEFEADVRKTVTVPLNDNQFSALVCFAYNIGTGAFSTATSLVQAINRGNFAKVPELWVAWNKYRDPKTGEMKVANGLTRRRKAEIELWQKKPIELLATITNPNI
jgi:lysozyme